ncbi:MAG TPA: anion transporter [Vicinamibacterales bacterium]|nr:anion transporter [Vicinamibacterales bacterium]
MDPLVVGVFAVVYLGMMLGELPGLKLDRTGIALLGAITLVASGRMSLDDAWSAIDVRTLALLLGLMVISAQFRLGGFYSKLTRHVGAGQHSPSALLALVVAASGGLSAVLANDIVCLAMAPVLIEVCTHRRLNPVPYLLALACAANVGSAATLIGNPQNMLIGQTLQLSFAGYLLDGGVPALAGLAVVWAVIVMTYRTEWHRDSPPIDVDAPKFDRWQTMKGAVVTLLVVVAFLFTDWPRELVALTAAGVLLVSRRLASRDMMGLVDWPLLVLFIGLFVVNRAIAQSGLVSGLLMMSRMAGADLTSAPVLFTVTAVLSNLVSNVPAVMLLLPAARDALDGSVLALSSTLAGNLIIVGSIANIIVVDQAARLGVKIDWRRHVRVGIPVTVVTLALAAGWLALRGW